MQELVVGQVPRPQTELGGIQALRVARSRAVKHAVGKTRVAIVAYRRLPCTGPHELVDVGRM